MKVHVFALLLVAASYLGFAQEMPSVTDDQKTPLSVSQSGTLPEHTPPIIGFWYPSTTYPALPSGTYFQAAAWLGDTLYVQTPTTTGAASSSIIKYTLGGSWTNGVPLPMAKTGGTLTACNGKLYYIGGGSSSITTGGAEVFEYRPSEGAWTQKTSMPTALSAHGAVCWGDSIIFVVGGPYTGPTTAIRAYRVASDSWISSTALPSGAQRRSAAVAISGNKILVAAGYSGSAFIKSFYIGTIGSDATQITWAAAPAVPTTYTGLSRPGGAAISNYFFTVCGERGGPGGYYDTTHIFDINANSWIGIINNKSIKMSNIFNGVAPRIINDTIKLFVPGGYGSATGSTTGAGAQTVFEVSAGPVSGGMPPCRQVNLAAGWNMLSVPLAIPNMQTTSLFPGASSSAYRYANGYLVSDTMQNGYGYWLRFTAAQSFNLCGNLVGASTIPVSTGWNMIGPYDMNVATAGITTTPAGIINSSFYSYQGGYAVADTLKFGKGYWIRVTQGGTLNLPAGLTKKPTASFAPQHYHNDWGRLIITDAAGNTKTVYLKTNSTDLSMYDLPPVPPTGVFDVRFNTNRDVANISEMSGVDVLLQSASYPLTLQAENVDLVLRSAVSDRLLNSVLKNGQTITLADASVSAIHIEGEVKPLQYTLEQNFPNPFNPATVIRYQIPEAGLVTLKVFDALGREVKTLVNENKDPGKFSIELNASGMASGIYMYELKCKSYRIVKKLTLLK